jgi:ribulose-5-phosphate 4-epimerase/fuculose-1-phosphate aldolase
VLASDEGEHITKALGNKKAALLGNHGLLAVGQSIEEIIVMFLCCEAQLAANASSAGGEKPLLKIGEMEARATWEAIGTHASGYCKHWLSYQGRFLTICSSGPATVSGSRA